MTVGGSNPRKHRFGVTLVDCNIPFDLQRCKLMVLKLMGSAEERNLAAVELAEVFKSLAFDEEGCRVAQDALESADSHLKVQLALKLSGHIRKAIDSPFANYVVQKIIEVLLPSHVKFIVDELIGSVIKVAQHPYGVRVLCRLVEHCHPKMIEELLLNIIENTSFLCRRKFGPYILQHIIEYGTADQRRTVVKALASNGLEFAKHRSGSALIQKALLQLETEERSELLTPLVKDETALLELARDKHGGRVVRAILALPGSESETVRMLVNRTKCI